jgi:hypothetical protein
VVLAGVEGGALVHVLGAVLARPAGRTAAAVRVHPVHAGGAVLAQVTRAVVDVLLAVVPREPCNNNRVVTNVGTDVGPVFRTRIGSNADPDPDPGF